MDKSGEICDACALKDKRIKVIHKKNGGVSAARNTGLQEARGEYITYADSDDLVGRTIYTELIDAMEQNGTDSACCSYEAFTGAGTEQGMAGSRTGVQKASGSSRSRGQICRGTEAFKVFLRENNYAPVVWNKVFKREVLKSAEGLFLFEKNTTLGRMKNGWRRFSAAERLLPALLQSRCTIGDGGTAARPIQRRKESRKTIWTVSGCRRSS